MDQKYDVIVIGAGEKIKSTVQMLSEQGQQVMYIELLPETLATMVCHHPKKNTPSSQAFQTDKEQNPMKTKIHFQKQTVQSTVGETITYTFHVEESVEITEVERVDIENDSQEEVSMDHSYLYQPPNHPQQKIEPFETEMVDDLAHSSNHTVLNEDTITFYEEESDSTIHEMDRIYYEIDNPSIEEGEPETIDLTEEVASRREHVSEKEKQDKNTIHHLNHSLKPSSLSQQKEREHELREKLIRRKGNKSLNLLMGDYQEEKESLEKPQESVYELPEEEMDRSAFLHSVLNKPSYSPRESRLRKRLSFKSKPQQTSEKTVTEHSSDVNLQPKSSSTQSNYEEDDNQQNIYSFEPFSSRRRVRAQKKGRMLTTAERFKSKPSPPKPLQQFEEQSFSSSEESFENQDLSYQESIVESSSAQQPIRSNEQFSLHSTTEITPSNLTIQSDQSIDSLKKDSIEFEEPYGGYHSLEDFLPPYSQNGRKRQEIDEIEKRKIALRGLHNLINNLG